MHGLVKGNISLRSGISSIGSSIWSWRLALYLHWSRTLCSVLTLQHESIPCTKHSGTNLIIIRRGILKKQKYCHSSSLTLKRLKCSESWEANKLRVSSFFRIVPAHQAQVEPARKGAEEEHQPGRVPHGDRVLLSRAECWNHQVRYRVHRKNAWWCFSYLHSKQSYKTKVGHLRKSKQIRFAPKGPWWGHNVGK